MLCVSVCGWGVDAYSGGGWMHLYLCSKGPPRLYSTWLHAHGVLLFFAVHVQMHDAHFCTYLSLVLLQLPP
jgi:hypothetical protein